MTLELRVAVDVGSARHRVAVGLSDGVLIEEFDAARSMFRLD